MRWLMHAKIHRATVTQAEPDYVGSITIDADLLDRTGLWPGERVLVSGEICMNGPAAHQIGAGEQVVIMGFQLSDTPVSPKVILVDGQNRFVQYLAETPGPVPAVETPVPSGI